MRHLGTWRLLVAALLVLALSMVSAVSGWAADGGDGSSSVAPEKAYSSPVAEASRAQAVARWRAEQRRLGSAGAREERVRSRSAFRGLSRAEAVRAAREKFAGMLASPVIDGLPLERGQRVLEWGSDYRALVTTEEPGKRAVLESAGIPLRVDGPDGKKVPLDLSLRETPGGFSPVAPLVALSIPRQATGRVEIGGGVGLSLVGADASAAQVEDDRAFYANVAEDLDAVVMAMPHGAQLLYVARSPAAPEAQSFDLDLPRGVELREASGRGARGAVDLVRDGERVGLLHAPLAKDAQGQTVKASYELVGDRVRVRFEHRGEDVAYPILVDPVVDYYSTSDVWSSWYTVTSSPNVWPRFSGAAQCAGYYNFLYTGSEYCAYRRRAAAGSFIYKLVLGGIWNWFNNDFDGGGLMDANVTAWEPGTWEDRQSSTSGTLLGAGTPAVRFHFGDYVNVWSTYCARAGCAVNGTTDNQTDWGMKMNSGWTANVSNHGPVTTLNHGYLYLSDNQIPTLGSVTHSGYTPGNWTKNATDTVAVSSSVPTGLGMGTLGITGPGVSVSQSNNCSWTRSAPCPNSYSTSFSLNANTLSEGKKTLRAYARNIAGNNSVVGTDPTWVMKVDRSKPDVTPGGTVWNSPNDRLSRGTHTLTVNATDGVPGGTDAQQRSGVKQIEIYVDGVFKKREEQTCPENQDSCPLSTSYTLNTTEYEDPNGGESQVDVQIKTLDRVGNPLDVKEKTVSIASTYSATCTSPSAKVFDGYAGSSTYVRLRAQPDPSNSNVTWLCYRASNGGSVDFGGRVEVAAAGANAGLPSDDGQWEQCKQAGGNASPVPEVVPAGYIGDPNFPNEPPPYTPYEVTSYANSGEAWLCVQVGSFTRRVKVPVPSAAPPGVTVHQDQPPTPPLPDDQDGPAGYPSSTCQSGLAGSSQRALNADVGPTHVWLYTAQPSQQKAHVCVRAQGPVSAGGQLVVDTSQGFGQTIISTSDDMAPCANYVNVFTQTSPQVSIKRTPTGQNPAEVCVTTPTAAKRVIIDANGSLLTPAATWTPDP
jgi:hypothetical protein